MSHTVLVRCPCCHASLRITSRRLDGKQATCPGCREPLVVAFDAGAARFVALLFVADWPAGPLADTVPLRLPDEPLAAGDQNRIRYRRDRAGRPLLVDAPRPPQRPPPRRTRWRTVRRGRSSRNTSGTAGAEP